MDLEKFKAFIQELIDEDTENERLSEENENFEDEMKYNYSASRLETVLGVLSLVDKM